VATDVDKIAAQTGKEEQEIRSVIQSVADSLYAARAKKIRPITDDKCLLAWNALMNMAISKAFFMAECNVELVCAPIMRVGTLVNIGFTDSP
jgi:uncharacterized protein YyaL (SSP411 family)